MRPLQIVIDTNVVVSALRSDTGASHRLLRAIGDPRWQMNLSTAMLLEYESAVKKEFNRRDWDLSAADDILDYLATASIQRTIFFRSRPSLPDPGDEFVLELAFASRADFIVTYNKKDFRGASAFGITTVTPSEFLEVLK